MIEEETEQRVKFAVVVRVCSLVDGGELKESNDCRSRGFRQKNSLGQSVAVLVELQIILLQLLLI